MFEELDTVELTRDVKEYGLKEGDMGAIVNIYNGGKAYEVEFVAPNGRTIALLTLMPKDIRPILNREVYFSRELDAPLYVSRVTVSGTAIDLTTNDLLKGSDTLELEIRTEMSKDEVSTEEFNFPRMVI